MAKSGDQDGEHASTLKETIIPPPVAHFEPINTATSKEEVGSVGSLSRSTSLEIPDEKPTPAPKQDDSDNTKDLELTQTQSQPLPSRRQIAPVMLAIYLALFLVTLDRTIVGVAIPVLSNQFHSFDDIQWYGSAYLLTTCSIQLLMGKIYTFYNVKWTYLACISLFELGSLICAASPNSIAFIWGRAIQGMGAAGVQNGGISIMVAVTPLKDRPLWMGLVGAFIGISSVVGPLIGGAFTTNVTWRWCFYINLPLGGIVMIIMFFLLKGDELKRKTPPWREQVRRLDPIGTLLFIPAIVCLLLALQWGGTKYGWGDARVFAPLIIFGLFILLWLADQVYQKENATLPLRLMKNRTVICGLWMTLTIGSSMLTMSYWLPTWFQAIKGASAAHAGVMNIPLVLAMVVAFMSTGIMVKKFGYYTPFAIAGSIIMPVGAGLFQLFTPTTSHSLWICAQVLFGFGTGLAMQQPNLAVQTVLNKKDVNSGIALMFFGQTLGGAIFVSVAQNILNNSLSKALAKIPSVNPRIFETSGATDFQSLIPAQYRAQALDGYNDALVDVFVIAVALAAASILGSVFLPWRSTNEKRGSGAPAKSAQKEAQGASKDGPHDASEKV